MNVKIRAELEKDFFNVEELTREAFWNLYRPGCDEHYLIHTMRSHPEYIKELAYIAVMDDKTVGCIMFTKSYVLNEKDERIETATFGPLCVHPKYQRKGIGTKLIEYTKELASQRGYPAIIILGDPHNYCKHGFKTGKDLNVSTIDGKYPLGLLVLELEKGIFDNRKWRFKESSAYELDYSKVDEYDRNFPIKDKSYAYSQEVFSILIRSFVE